MTDSGRPHAKAQESTVPLALYSQALDEVYELRRALAYEAGVVAVHAGYKTFPKSRRGVVDAQVDRMRMAAQGYVAIAYAEKSGLVLRHALRVAGADETLTRSQWEAEHGIAPRQQDQPHSSDGVVP